MSKIKLMDQHLANMIAAGEVVERPGGIIKELIENSLDAGATHIDVKIDEGGMAWIEVSDNGEGMDAEDLQAAFKRHSTSKIMQTSDLNRIVTFGFRGEALPSIASVSLVEAISSNGEESHRLIIDNGQKQSLMPFPRNQGTTITIQNLFLKTPARLKHIKNTHYETTVIIDIVQKFAAGSPHVSFSLHSASKELFRSYQTGDRMDVFHRIYGGAVSRDALLFSDENYDFKVSGIMALPQHSRANRHGLWLYVNQRMVRYPRLQNAIIAGYRHYLPKDRYPLAIIMIEVDPQLVDVNVHPSKWEIRMSMESELIALITQAIETSLRHQARPQRVALTPRPFREDKQAFFPDDWLVQEPLITHPETSGPAGSPANDPAVLSGPQVSSDTKDLAPTLLLEPLRVLAQMSGKYILAQGNEGLYIIDQHAAMERIRYEYFQKKLLKKDHDLQPLLVPLLIEDRKGLVAQLDEINHLLREFALHLELMGDDAFVLREHPLWIHETELSEFIGRVLDLFQESRTVDEADLRKDALASLACHSSVRFNEYLSLAEMEALVDDLRQCQQPLHCPHGRPTFVVMDHRQLKSEFKR